MSARARTIIGLICTLGVLLTALPATAQAAEGLSVAVRLRGATGSERFVISVGSETLVTGVASREWDNLEVEIPAGSTGELAVAFVNDGTEGGHDRNLFVESLTFVDEVIATTSNRVYSEGAFDSRDGCSPGFRQLEMLGCTGKMIFGELTADRTLEAAVDPHGNQRRLPLPQPHHVDVVARGSVGGERFTVRIGEVTVGEAITTRHWRTYRFVGDLEYTGDLSLEFTNDFRSDNIDSNLDIDWVAFNGQHYETEAPSTISTGTWSAAGCVPGNWRSETLHCAGRFVFAEL